MTNHSNYTGRKTRTITGTLLAYMLIAAAALGADVPSGTAGLPLVSPGQPLLGWKFNDASATDGSTGALAMNADKHEGHDGLLFSGDFTRGGNYLEISYAVPNLDVASVTMWLNSSTLTYVRLRIEDSTGQWHQMKVAIPGTGAWAKWSFPLDRYFTGKSDPSDPAVSEYTSWNGANDQKWHGPMQSFDLLIEPPVDTDSKKVSLGISEPTVQLAAASPNK